MGYVDGSKVKVLYVLEGLHLKKKKMTMRIKIFGVFGIIWACKRTWDMEGSYWITEWMEGRLKLRITLVGIKKVWNTSDYINIQRT